MYRQLKSFSFQRYQLSLLSLRANSKPFLNSSHSLFLFECTNSRIEYDMTLQTVLGPVLGQGLGGDRHL